MPLWAWYALPFILGLISYYACWLTEPVRES